MAMGKSELASHMRELARQLPDMELNGLMVDSALFKEDGSSVSIELVLEDGSELKLTGEGI